MLHNLGTFIWTKEISHWCSTISCRFYSYFPSVSPTVLFEHPVQDSLLYLVIMFPSSSNLWQCSGLYLLWPRHFRRILGRYFCSVCVLGTQSWLPLCNPMDCSQPGFSVYGIFQARILEWVAIPFSMGSSQSRDGTWVSCIAARFFTAEPRGKPLVKNICTACQKKELAEF